MFDRYVGKVTHPGGAGLASSGLYIARADRWRPLGAESWFESRVNEGTTFLFTLPYSDDATACSSRPSD